jgi:hypothetical protein
MQFDLDALRTLYPELPEGIVPQVAETLRQYAELAADISARHLKTALTPNEGGGMVSEGSVEPRTLTTIG